MNDRSSEVWNRILRAEQDESAGGQAACREERGGAFRSLGVACASGARRVPAQGGQTRRWPGQRNIARVSTARHHAFVSRSRWRSRSARAMRRFVFGSGWPRHSGDGRNCDRSAIRGPGGNARLCYRRWFTAGPKGGRCGARAGRYPSPDAGARRQDVHQFCGEDCSDLGGVAERVRGEHLPHHGFPGDSRVGRLG